MCLVWLEICSPHWIRTLQILIQCILQYSSCMYIYIYISLSLFSYIYNIYLFRLYIRIYIYIYIDYINVYIYTYTYRIYINNYVYIYIIYILYIYIAYFSWILHCAHPRKQRNPHLFVLLATFGLNSWASQPSVDDFLALTACDQTSV